MKTRNQAAFPLKHSEDKFNPGMTLRDYFAGQIITGIVSNHSMWEELPSIDSVTTYAYQIAQSLLIARQQYEPKNNG